MDEKHLLWLRRVTVILMVALVVVIAAFLVRGMRKGGRQKLLRLQPERFEGSSGSAKGEMVGVYHGFEFTESVAGKTVFILRADRTLGLSSGWQNIQGVQLELFREGKKTATLTCDNARFNPQTRDTRVSGAVHVQFGEGGFVDTESGRMDSSSRSFITHSKVVFSSGSAVGESGRAVYNLTRNELILDHGVAIGQPGGRTLRTPLLRYLRGEHRVLLPREWVLSSGGSTVRAAHGEITMTKEGGSPNRIRLLGGVAVEGPAGAHTGAFQAWAEEINARRQPDGSWQVTATTTGPWVRFKSRGANGLAMRSLKTWRIRAVLGQEGPVSAECDPVVCLGEITPEGRLRTGEAQTAKIWFQGGQPAGIDLKGAVHLIGDGVEAQGASARLLQSAGRVVLGSDPKELVRATLHSAGSRVTAARIEILDGEDAARARGDVQGELEQGVGLLSGNAGQGQERVRFAAQALDVKAGGSVLHLKDNARVWQGRRLLLADEVIYDRKVETMEALGHVRTTFPSGELNPGTTGGEEVLVVARSLKYDRGTGVAVYKGAVRYSDGARILSAAKLGVRFAEDHSVRTVKADDQVNIIDLAENRRMTGDHALFNSADRSMKLTGSLVKITDAEGNVVTGTSLTWNGADGTVTISGGKNAPSETIFHPEEKH